MHKLEENGVRSKVIAPENELSELVEEILRYEHGRLVEEALHDLVSLDEARKELADESMDEFELKNARRLIEEGFEEDVTLSWRGEQVLGGAGEERMKMTETSAQTSRGRGVPS